MRTALETTGVVLVAPVAGSTLVADWATARVGLKGAAVSTKAGDVSTEGAKRLRRATSPPSRHGRGFLVVRIVVLSGSRTVVDTTPRFS